MKISRHETRVNAVILIYQTLMRSDSLETLYEIAEESGEFAVTDAVKELAGGAHAKQEELDAIIQQYSPKRAVSRIAKLLHAILLVALYEMCYDDGTPDNAAISEAVIICEEFSYFPEDVRFLNGLLGSFARSRAAETAPAEDGTQA